MTPEALDWYRTSQRELNSADNTIGPLHLLPAVTMHIRTIKGMLTHSSGGLQDELLRAGAGFAVSNVLTALPAGYRRDRGQYLARLATASALANLPEKACAEADEALTIALATGSSRTLAEIHRFTARATRRWPTLPQVTALRDMLGSLAPDRKT